MRNRKIFDAVTALSDALIEEAAAPKRKTRWLTGKRLAAAAALLALVISIGYPMAAAWIDRRNWSTADAVQMVVWPEGEMSWDERRLQENQVTLLDALDDFACRTAAPLLLGEENTNYSPLSLYLSLGVLAQGAEGDTLDELLGLLGAYNKEYLAQQSSNLFRRTWLDSDIAQLRIANSLWLDKRAVFMDDFVRTAAEDYYAASFNVDMRSDETTKQMTEWVSANTNGRIVPELETHDDSGSPVPTERLLYIFNTIYFYDQWGAKFPDHLTKPQPFYRADGSEVEVSFMHRPGQSQGTFYRGDNFTRASQTLENTGKMTFILPDEGVSVDQLLQDADVLQEALYGGTQHNGKITWAIPKFSFANKLELIGSLKKLGIESAFDEKLSDFSAMTNWADQTGYSPYVSEVIQETYIGIDEKGVEAAAFTRIEVGATGAAPGPEKLDEAEMILDRPFIYLIQAADGVPLFVGVVRDPGIH